MAAQTTELDGEQHPAKPPEEKAGRSLGDLVQSAAQIIVSAFLIVLVIAIFARLVDDKRNRPILIDPFGVPQALENQGYTGQVVASEIGDEIARIELATKTYARKQDVALASSETLPPLEIPETGLSMDVLVNFLEDFLNITPRHLGGELTFEDNSESLDAAGPNSGSRRVVITIRVTGMEGRGKSVDIIAHNPDDAIVQAAREALEMIDPYVLAYYSYVAHEDPEIILQLTSECEGSSIKWARNLEGLLLDDQHDYAGAIAKYRQAISLDPNFAYVYINWGKALMEQANYTGAIAKFQKAIQLNPGSALAYYNWGVVLYNQHDYPGAIARFQKAIALDPSNPDDYVGCGVALLAQHDYAAAIAELQKAADADPQTEKYRSDLAVSYSNWGNVLAEQHKYNSSIDKYQRALEADPGYAAAYNNWGDVLYTQQDYSDAVAEFQKAAELNPGDAGTYNNWGNALAGQNDYADAIEKFQKAVDLDPQNQMYRSHLEAAARNAQTSSK